VPWAKPGQLRPYLTVGALDTLVFAGRTWKHCCKFGRINPAGLIKERSSLYTDEKPNLRPSQYKCSHMIRPLALDSLKIAHDVVDGQHFLYRWARPDWSQGEVPPRGLTFRDGKRH
jgi:hypothetical protein